jgi:hypothetical protein
MTCAPAHGALFHEEDMACCDSADHKPLLLSLFVQVTIADCTDTFTGLPIPYAVAGVSPSYGSFQVSSTDTIAASSPSYAPANFSYTQLGLDDWAPQLAYSDIFMSLRSGWYDLASKVLEVDLQFMAASSIIAGTLLGAPTTTNSSICNTTTELQHALASWIATRTTPVNLTEIPAAILSFNESCSIDPVYLSSIVNSTASLVTTFANTVPQLHEPGWLADELSNLAHFASFMSTFNISNLVGTNLSDHADIRRLIDASPIMPQAILSAAGIYGAPPMDTMIQLRSVGPLVGAVATHKFFSSMIPSILPPSDVNGMVMVPNATFGRYLIPAGALDVYLTTNYSSPVVTIAPMVAVLGFPYTNQSIVISPAAGMVYAMYETWMRGPAPANSTMFVNNVPDSQWFRAVYEAITDGPLPYGDYLARDYPSCSPASLAVAASDVLVSGTTGLIGLFISKAYNQSYGDSPSSMVSDSVLHPPIQQQAYKHCITLCRHRLYMSAAAQAVLMFAAGAN